MNTKRTIRKTERVRVVRWGSYDEEADEKIGGLGGWFDNGHRWKDFVDQIGDTEEGHYAALRADIIERGIRRGGDWHQNNDEGVPFFSDGTRATFSYRAWGDLLAAVWSDVDGKDYSYMHFYMDGWGALSAEEIGA